MTPEQQAAIIYAASARASIRALGMASENAERMLRGEMRAYSEDAFLAIIREEGIDHDNVLLALGYVPPSL
ncbi:MAG TPA: hypothetical protein VN444_04265 [Verrucomicrobiae bacterium]|nr:hypothetical protein [Verrucomicrobiae bacterium]